MKTIAQFEHVTKSYASGEAKTSVLKDLNFSIGTEEMTAFVGPSGSGKTTILNLLGCIDKPDAGVIIIDGRETEDLSAGTLAELRNDKIGFIFQSFNLIPVLTAFENVEFPLLLSAMKDREVRKSRVMEMLKLVGIEKLHNRLPSQLSGGQQQRVAVARALVKNPLLVLADEPTANLDSKAAAETLEIMREMNRELKTTFVFSTHDQKIMQFARRLIYLEDGNIIKEEVK
jgi:putative ABC transport system ATP-binding protein